MNKLPKINVDILVIRKNKILLGLLTEKWKYKGQQVYGVAGQDIKFGEKIGDTVKRNIREEFNCSKPIAISFACRCRDINKDTNIICRIFIYSLSL